jgi:hypothetical protein
MNVCEKRCRFVHCIAAELSSYTSKEKVTMEWQLGPQNEGNSEQGLA